MKSNVLFETTSNCHGVKSIIVRSREGGFVTQNCVQCGKPRAIKKEDLPMWHCIRCGAACEAILNRNKNYAFNMPYLSL